MNIDARAAARLLGVTEEKIHRWASEGIIPCIEVQEQLRFNRVELLEWATARRRKIETGVFSRDRGGASSPLSRALEAGGIHRDLDASSERSALEALAARLPVPEGTDREVVRALFLAREGSTTAQGGIAIPHARSPAVLGIQEPSLVLGFFAKAFDAKAPDGTPVFAAFAILSPTVRSHLHVLSKLSAALSDDAFRALLERRAPDAELLARLREVEAPAPRRSS